MSLLYYGIIISYAGINTAFSWFWLILGIGCFFCFVVIRYMIKYEISTAKPIRYIMAGIIAVGLGIFLLIEGTLIYHANQKADPGMDYIIVLGAQVKGTRVSNTLKKRLDTAVSYLKENPATVAIVSGGQGVGEDISEAEAMKSYLLQYGIEEKRIIKEEKSTNTNENIRFSKELMRTADAPVAIVTNGFHVFRAVGIAKKQGLSSAQGLSAPSDKILFINYYIREVLGVMKDKFMGNL